MIPCAGQRAENARWFEVAERDADDRAAVLFGQANGIRSDAGERGPVARGELVVAGVDGVGPEVVEHGESGLVADRGEPAMELSKRDAVGERFIWDRRSCQNGTRRPLSSLH